MTRITLLAVAAAFVLAGCVENGEAPSTEGGGSAITPKDATWPEVQPDPEALSNLHPLWLRLEMQWPPERGAPTSATLWLVTGDEETPLPTNFTLGSVDHPPGSTGRETLTFNLSGGLMPLRQAQASLVETREVTFAGAAIGIPTLTREVSLLARGTWRDDGGGSQDFEQPLTLKPRDSDLVVGPPYYNATEGTFGITPHPGGFYHPLEDGALHAWATEEKIINVGSSGNLDEPPGPPSLDLLVITGMGGGVVTVEAD